MTLELTGNVAYTLLLSVGCRLEIVAMYVMVCVCCTMYLYRHLVILALTSWFVSIGCFTYMMIYTAYYNVATDLLDEKFPRLIPGATVSFLASFVM